MKKFIHSLDHYSMLALLALLVLVVLKLVEISAGPFDSDDFARVLVNGMVYNLIVFSWMVLVFAPIFLAIRHFSQRAASITMAVVWAFLTLSEVGLTIYSAHNGYLLGSEFLVRPFAEMWLSIRGSVGLFLPIFAVLALFTIYILWALWTMRKSARCWVTTSFLSICIVFTLLSAIFSMSKLQDYRFDTWIINKTRYLITDCIRYLRSDQDGRKGKQIVVEYDAEKISKLLATHPEWTPIDPEYPLEREDNTPDVLSPYFADSQTAPNVVFLIVESMGDEYMSCGLMPFVDSLAQNGLYWRNCLSTTMRSYGAVPAITGSVDGPKSFQFGNMPDHNSMLSILKHAGYHSNAFYAGTFAFDCIFDYLQKQQVDYYSPFYEEFRTVKNNPQGTSWGYHDGIMLQRTIEELPPPSTDPMVNLIVTLTMHEDLALSDAKQQSFYEQKAEPALKNLKFDCSKSHAASCAYTDDCLRKFFAQYSRRSDFGNTIFVITGDHSSGLRKDNKLCFHHVPLIIYSPLLTTHAEFSHLVTHQDISPSLCRLLSAKYNVPMPATVHWLGRGLYQAPKTMLIVNYSHEIQEMIWNGYYYQRGNSFEQEMAWKIEDDMSMKVIWSDSLFAQCRRQMELLRYLYQYTYNANRLTKHPIFASKQYQLIRNYIHGGDLKCVTPSYKPSEKGNVRFYLLPQTELKSTEGFPMARITLSADVLVLDSLWQDNYMNLVFCFDNGTELIQSDKISKFIDEEVLRKDSTYHIQVSKEYPITPNHTPITSVYISTASYDDQWIPNTRLTIKNSKVSIEYGK